MAEFTADFDSALVRDGAAGATSAGRALNPLWQVMLTGQQDETTRSETSGTTSDHEPEHQEIVTRALSAPCVAAIGVTPARDGAAPGTAGPGRRELDISIDAVGIVLTSRGQDGRPRWSIAAPQDLDAIVMGLVPTGSRLAAPASMTTRSEATRLQLAAQQRESLRRALAQGTDTEEALDGIPELDPRWRDALSPDGDRASFAVHFAPPAAPERVTLLRRWTSGVTGLYSADGPRGPLTGMHQVEDGDFYGTVIPLLHEGVRVARDGDAA